MNEKEVETAYDRAAVPDAIWTELVKRFPRSELKRVRGVIDVMAGRAEPQLQPMQGVRLNLFMPELPSLPWLDRGKFEDIASELERLYPDMKREILSDCHTFRPYGQLTDEPDVDYPENPKGWDELRLWEDLKPTSAVLSLPATSRAIKFIVDRCSLLNHVGYLAMKPDTHLQAHHDRTNWFVSIHMGITVPVNCGIRVGSETRRWAEGKCIFFDNSFEHEAWNRDISIRIIFAVYIAHPDLSSVERAALTHLQRRYLSLTAVGEAAALTWARTS